MLPVAGCRVIEDLGACTCIVQVRELMFQNEQTVVLMNIAGVWGQWARMFETLRCLDEPGEPPGGVPVLRWGERLLCQETIQPAVFGLGLEY